MQAARGHFYIIGHRPVHAVPETAPLRAKVVLARAADRHSPQILAAVSEVTRSPFAKSAYRFTGHTTSPANSWPRITGIFTGPALGVAALMDVAATYPDSARAQQNLVFFEVGRHGDLAYLHRPFFAGHSVQLRAWMHSPWDTFSVWFIATGTSSSRSRKWYTEPSACTTSNQLGLSVVSCPLQEN